MPLSNKMRRHIHCSRNGMPQEDILVVEDDDGIRETLQMFLENEGYHVASATNGQEALQLMASSAAPCLILLDLMMPVMNGWEFAAVLQQSDTLATPPIVLMTAYEKQANDIPAQGLLKKPIMVDELMSYIKKYCGSR